MSDENILNENIHLDVDMQELKKVLNKSFNEYRKAIKFMAADAPIEILCLPRKIESFLLDSGCLRVYDVFDLDFTKIKGLDNRTVRDFTTRIDQFFSML